MKKLFIALFLLASPAFGQTGINQTGCAGAPSNYVLAVGGCQAPGTATIGNSVLYAVDYSGVDAGAQIQACVNALPSTGGTCDARGLTTSMAASSNLILGSDTKPVILLLGAGSLSLGSNQIEYFSGTSIVGMGANPNGFTSATQISSTSAAVFVYGGAASAVGMRIRGMTITDSSPGSTGIDFSKTLNSTVSSVRVSADTGLKIGGVPGSCECYNSFYDLDMQATTYGIQVLAGANQNQWYGGKYWGAIGIYLNGGFMNSFFSPDMESNSTAAVEITSASTNNSIYSPYLEATATDIVLDSGTKQNLIWGASASAGAVSDNSGNSSNYYLLIGASGTGVSSSPTWPIGQSGSSPSSLLYSNCCALIRTVGSSSYPFDLNWTGQASTTYGHYGHAHINVGHLGATGGVTLSGFVDGSKLADPGGLIVTQVGTAGTASYTYYVVGHDEAGGETNLSAAVTTTTGNATLNSTNYNKVCWNAVDGVWTWDILRGSTTTSITTGTAGNNDGSGHICYNDTGTATSVYVPPARNSTGDVSVAGQLTLNSPTVGFQDKGSQLFNVKAYGALGNGSNDDTTAIQNAINAAVAVPGGIVFFPPGKYNYTNLTISNGSGQGITLEGAGPAGGGPGSQAGALAASYLWQTGTGIGLTVGSPTTFSYNGPIIANLGFHEGTAGHSAAAIMEWNQSYSEIRHVMIEGYTAAPLAVPATPTVAAVGGGSLASGTYTVKVTYDNAIGWGMPSAFAQATTSGTCPGSGSCSIQVTSPAASTGATGYDVWFKKTGGDYYLQNRSASGPTAIGTNVTISSGPDFAGFVIPKFDESAGTGIKFEGADGYYGSSTAYVNQPMLIDVNTTGTINGIVGTDAVAGMYVMGGNLNLKSNTAGCGLLAAAGNFFTHAEQGDGGSTQFCFTGFGGYANVTTDGDGSPTKPNGITMSYADYWDIAADCGGLVAPADSISLDANSSDNFIRIRGNGSCDTPVNSGVNNTIQDLNKILFTMGAPLVPHNYTVSTLPSASTDSGAMVKVTDSTAITSEGQTCVGSSTNTALAFSNGSSWKCF